MDAIDFLEDTVKIRSHETVDEIRDYLLENVEGAETHESGCVVASKGGNEVGGNAPHVVFNTHMDVVPPHVEFERENGIIKGRGSCDAKASLAAMATAFRRADVEDGELSLVISPDEETLSTGLYEYIGSEYKNENDASVPDMAVVGEPTGLDICTAARGRFEVIVSFEGEAAHAASGAGTSAVSCAAEAIRRLDSLLGDSRLTVTQIEGGEASNQVPEEASFFIDRRSVPPETQDEFLEKVKDELTGLDCTVSVRFSDRPTPFLEAFRTAEDEAVVGAVSSAIETVTGDEAVIRPFDASYFTQLADVPVVVFGAGLISEGGEPVAHSEREYVRVEEVETATDVLTKFLNSTV
ncbi:MAG: M20/M25/M40 family metallo-hydrolase [Halobacteria archaeon]|nr:M20/M25/M40 family metallo-hydrolase [Halobacteria archaeon]